MTDVVMSEMSGPQVAENLTAKRPNMRVLYVSGYPNDGVVPQSVLDSGCPFLQKIFGPLTLTKKVGEVLDRQVTSNERDAVWYRRYAGVSGDGSASNAAILEASNGG